MCFRRDDTIKESKYPAPSLLAHELPSVCAILTLLVVLVSTVYRHLRKFDVLGRTLQGRRMSWDMACKKQTPKIKGRLQWKRRLSNTESLSSIMRWQDLQCHAYALGTSPEEHHQSQYVYNHTMRCVSTFGLYFRLHFY